ncbi:hypothetical protein ACFFRR_009792 [Megaselia abdita]
MRNRALAGGAARSLRKTTIEQSQVKKSGKTKTQIVARETGTKPKINILPPTSPLVVPNGTSSPQFITVTRSKRRTATTVTIPRPQPEINVESSSCALTRSNKTLYDETANKTAQTFSEVVVGVERQQQKQQLNMQEPQNVAAQTQKQVPLDRRLKLAQRTKFKAMFIANLDENLTEKELYDYLLDEGGQRIVEKLKIFKINTRRKHESAFKLICPEVLFGEITNMWEDGVTVREFYYNNNPDSIDNQAKN